MAIDFDKYYKKGIIHRGAILGDLLPEIYEQFREDALKEVGLWGHPKADVAYSLAWKHANLLEDAFENLSDLASLFDEKTV